MIYRNLGTSGLKVSVISLGNMINCKPENQLTDKALIKTCIESGINFFDTAELYEKGMAEVALGRFLKQIGSPRENLVIATKIWTSPQQDINSFQKSNRKHIREGIQQSLKRLQLEYVDLVYAHNFDPTTPLEETCRAFHEVVERNEALYWGVCNWDAQVIFEAFEICEKLNLHKPITSQVQYNMLSRHEVEVQYRKLIEDYNFKIVGWSGLAGGILTGKYLKDSSNGNGSEAKGLNRFNDSKSAFSLDVMRKVYHEPHCNKQPQLRKLQSLCEQKLQCKMNHLALAWVVKFEGVSSTLIGARNSDQLLDNLKTLDVVDKITPEIQEEIESLLNQSPSEPVNFLTNKPKLAIRISGKYALC